MGWGWIIKVPLPPTSLYSPFLLSYPLPFISETLLDIHLGNQQNVCFTSFQSVFMVLGECLTYVGWPLHKRLWKLFPFSLIRACGISGFWAVNFLSGDRWAYVVEVVVFVELRSWSFCTFLSQSCTCHTDICVVLFFLLFSPFFLFGVK